ncbi:transcriptional repressor TraM [Rhizobium nepotum]|uniref:transcriptional repressor TraM n=1 Tax=Rhizobium nepotum TaxID=1035271 RepID=UPI00336AB809
MDRSQLEELAVSAIREHRALLAADQIIYDEWTRASEDPSVPSSVMQSLQEEYLSRQRRSEAQQEKLSDIIETLGFVPTVAEDDKAQGSE